jgi:hypothetical protein
MHSIVRNVVRVLKKRYLEWRSSSLNRNTNSQIIEELKILSLHDILLDWTHIWSDNFTQVGDNMVPRQHVFLQSLYKKWLGS